MSSVFDQIVGEKFDLISPLGERYFRITFIKDVLWRTLTFREGIRGGVIQHKFKDHSTFRIWVEGYPGFIVSQEWWDELQTELGVVVICASSSPVFRDAIRTTNVDLGTNTLVSEIIHEEELLNWSESDE